MEKNRKINTKTSAYLTVYLTLTMTVLLSLCLVLIEGVRSNAIRMETECVMDIGMNSILAEYHRELLEQYNLFAIDSSYGTEYAGKENTRQHLQKYVERNLSADDIFLSDFLYRDFLAMSLKKIDLTKVSVFTDDKGAVFRKSAAEAVKDDVGLTLLEEIQQWMQVVDAENLDTRDVAAQKRALDEQMEQIIRDAEEERKEVDKKTGEIIEVEIPFENPTRGLEEKRKQGILRLVLDNPDSVSMRRIPVDALVMSRMETGNVNQGNMDSKDQTEAGQLLERFFFQEYLLRYMGHYGNEDESNAMLYQVEYLIAGEECDFDNLQSIAGRICFMREVANTVYILSDEVKCGEAELLATVVSALLQVPELAEPLKMALLLGWAYAESLYDVRVILAGGRIPLMKSAETWHYSLEGALREEGAKTGGQSEGLSYKDYLRIFMTLMNQDTLTGRAMNVVEADIRQTAGNSNFRLDGCYDSIEVCLYIESAYGYEYEITRQKGYK